MDFCNFLVKKGIPINVYTEIIYPMSRNKMNDYTQTLIFRAQGKPNWRSRRMPEEMIERILDPYMEWMVTRVNIRLKKLGISGKCGGIAYNRSLFKRGSGHYFIE